MRKTMLITALALGAAVAAIPALAGEGRRADPYHCRVASGETLLPAETIRKTLEELGYRVDHIRIDDGCYDARAVNDSGIPIEARYHPVTGELVRARLRS